jgi:hypothetical protein
MTLLLFCVDTDRCWRGARSTITWSSRNCDSKWASSWKRGRQGNGNCVITLETMPSYISEMEIYFLCHTVFSHRGSMLLCKCVNTCLYREVHHICTLLGYGMDAICPYLVYETVSRLRDNGLLTPTDAPRNLQGHGQNGTLHTTQLQGRPAHYTVTR